MASGLVPAAGALSIVACYGTLAGFVLLCAGTVMDWQTGPGRAGTHA